MTDDILKITVGQAEDHQRAARERLRRAEAGESGESIEQDARFILNLEDFADIERLMRTSNLALLDAIISEQPESIRQAATTVDRDYKEVHRNLQELESLGVIEFTREGTNKKPILRGEAETIDFSFQIQGHREIGDRTGASA